MGFIAKCIVGTIVVILTIFLFPMCAAVTCLSAGSGMIEANRRADEADHAETRQKRDQATAAAKRNRRPRLKRVNTATDPTPEPPTVPTAPEIVPTPITRPTRATTPWPTGDPYTATVLLHERVKKKCESLDDDDLDALHAYIVEQHDYGVSRDKIARLARDWAKAEGFCDNLSCSPCVKAILRYGP